MRVRAPASDQHLEGGSEPREARLRAFDRGRRHELAGQGQPDDHEGERGHERGRTGA